jgi:large repetitive protein
VEYTGLADGAHSVKVRAIDAAGNVDASPASYSWTVDTQAPETTIGSKPANPSASASASIGFSSEAGASMECSLDDAAYAACTSPAEYAALTDGAHSVKVRAIDAAGNVDPTPASYSWTVDTQAPDTTIASKPASLSTSASASIGFSSEAGASMECSLDDAAYAACSSPKEYTGLAEGAHSFRVRAIDEAGNEDASPASYSWTVDTLGPETTIDSKPANPTASASASIGFSAETGAAYECSLDDAVYAACSSPVEYTGLADGAHTFRVRATDTAGNVDQSPASYTWTVDTQAPETTIGSKPANPSASASANFGFTSDESGSTYQCRLDGQPDFVDCSNPQAYSGLGDGAHSIEVRAVDAAGNIDPTPATYSWTVDTVAPETTIGSKPDDPTASASASIGFSSGDAEATFECSLDDAAYAACSSPKEYTGLASGNHSFRVRAVDAAGNADATPSSYTWRVDTGAPETTIDSGPGAATPATSATLTFSSSEPGSTFDCSLDGASFGPCVSPREYSVLAVGVHEFRVRATDSVGNVDASPATYSWRVLDSTPPTTTITDKPADPSTSASATFSFAGTDDVDSAAQLRYECRFDSDGAADFADCSNPKTYSGLGAGDPYTLDVRAVDQAGNVDPTPASYSWTVTPPDCGTQSVGANADAWVEQGGPSSNKGTDSGLKVTSKAAANTRALVRFPLPTVPAGCVLDSATLRMYASSASDGRTLRAIRLAGSWAEDGVTWNNQPATTGTAATLVSGANPGHREWNVTPQITAMDAGSNNGFLIRDATEDNGGSEHQFNSREKADNQPQLVYRFAPVAGSAPNCGSAATLGANADAWIDQAGPTANKGSDPTIKVNSKGPAHNTRGLVRFSLPAVPTGCSIQSATLRLHASAVSLTERTIEALQVADAWSEGGVSWSNQPTTTGEAATTATGTGAGYREWNVSSHVQAMYAGANHGFLIRDAGENYAGAEQLFNSRENALERPQLIVRFGIPDTRPPKTTIDSGPSGTSTSTSATFAFSANETGSTFECSLDGAEFGPCASPHEYTGLELGNHEVRVRAIDRAGNLDASPASRSWTIELPPDVAAPDTSITGKPSDPSPSQAPSLGFTGTDDSTPASMLAFECRLDGAAYAACTSPRNYSSLSAGSHTFEVRATDLAGRVDPSPATYSWTIDPVAPQTTINIGPPSTTESRSASFTFSSNETGTTYECSLDTAPFAACTSPRDLSGLATGSHTFRVRAIDAAGNIDLTPASRSWTVTAPTCTGSTATAGSAADSWVSQSAPTTNYGNDSVAKVASKSGANSRALFRFNLPSIPAGCEVTQAKLRLYAGSYKAGRTIQALRLAAAWTEGSVTWNNQPATAGVAATAPSGSVVGYLEWTVTAQVAEMYMSGNNGFLIRDASEDGGGDEQGFHAREKIPDNVPELVITFS